MSSVLGRPATQCSCKVLVRHFKACDSIAFIHRAAVIREYKPYMSIAAGYKALKSNGKLVQGQWWEVRLDLFLSSRFTLSFVTKAAFISGLPGRITVSSSRRDTPASQLRPAPVA